MSELGEIGPNLPDLEGLRTSQLYRLQGIAGRVLLDAGYMMIDPGTQLEGLYRADNPSPAIVAGRLAVEIEIANLRASAV